MIFKSGSKCALLELDKRAQTHSQTNRQTVSQQVSQSARQSLLVDATANTICTLCILPLEQSAKSNLANKTSVPLLLVWMIVYLVEFSGIFLLLCFQLADLFEQYSRISETFRNDMEQNWLSGRATAGVC